MQFTTGLVTLALAIAGASAAPNAAIEERQTPGLVYVKFYGKGGCQGNFIEDTVYFDDRTGVCKIETFQGPYLSWAVESNEALRPLNVYSRSDCTTKDGGNVINVPAGHTQCYTQHIGSVQFGN